MRIRFYFSLSLLVLLATHGCSGSSEVEMKQAQAAMEQAKGLHAESLAPSAFQQAQKAWERAQAAEKEGNTGTAKTLFSSAKIFFGKAADIAKARHDSLSRELGALQRRNDSNLDQVERDLARVNLSPRQQDQVRTIALEVREGNASIENLVIQNDLPKAVATAKDVQTKIYTAQVILSEPKIR
jgi:hypothetical protein